MEDCYVLGIFLAIILLELSQTDKDRIYGIIEELKKEELANE